MKRMLPFFVSFMCMVLLSCVRQHKRSALDIHQLIIQEQRRVEVVDVEPPFAEGFYPVRQQDKILKVWTPGFTLNDTVTIGPHYFFVLVRKSEWINRVEGQ
jgi:hypothetical protein